jgi:hypothetical protein
VRRAAGRDFSLTEEQARRALGGRAYAQVSRRGGPFALGVRRTLGGTLAAAGLVGALLVGSVSLLATPGSQSVSDNAYAAGNPQEQLAAGSRGASDASSGSLLGVGASPGAAQADASPEIAIASPAASHRNAPSPAVIPAAPTAGPVSLRTPAEPAGSQATDKSVGDNGENASITTSGGSGLSGPAERFGLPAEFGWLLAFGLVFLAGLVVLLGPTAWKRLRRR